jgi:hypothetical protein
LNLKAEASTVESARNNNVKHTFKGTVSRDFLLQVFSWTIFPQAQEIALGSFHIFFKLAEIFACKSAPLVSTIPAKNISTGTAGVVDTGGKFATSVNDNDVKL